MECSPVQVSYVLASGSAFSVRTRLQGRPECHSESASGSGLSLCVSGPGCYSCCCSDTWSSVPVDWKPLGAPSYVDSSRAPLLGGPHGYEYHRNQLFGEMDTGNPAHLGIAGILSDTKTTYFGFGNRQKVMRHGNLIPARAWLSMSCATMRRTLVVMPVRRPHRRRQVLSWQGSFGGLYEVQTPLRSRDTRWRAWSLRIRTRVSSNTR